MITKNQQTIVHTGSIIEVVETQVVLKNGKEKTFEHARRSPGVRCIITNENDEILLTKEFRHELNYRNGEFDFRLPGGKFFDSREEWKEAMSKNDFNFEEASQTAGLREMKEETGYELTKQSKIEYLGVAHNGATVEWDLHYQMFTNVAAGERIIEEGEEHITSQFYSKATVLEMIKNGEIQEGRSVAMLVRVLL